MKATELFEPLRRSYIRHEAESLKSQLPEILTGIRLCSQDDEHMTIGPFCDLSRMLLEKTGDVPTHSRSFFFDSRNRLAIPTDGLSPTSGELLS